MKRISFDQGVPVPLRNALVAVGVVETEYERGWATLKNGALVEMASQHFDVLVTTDKNLVRSRRSRDELRRVDKRALTH